MDKRTIFHPSEAIGPDGLIAYLAVPGIDQALAGKAQPYIDNVTVLRIEGNSARSTTQISIVGGPCALLFLVDFIINLLVGKRYLRALRDDKALARSLLLKSSLRLLLDDGFKTQKIN